MRVIIDHECNNVYVSIPIASHRSLRFTYVDITVWATQ